MDFKVGLVWIVVDFSRYHFLIYPMYSQGQLGDVVLLSFPNRACSTARGIIAPAYPVHCSDGRILTHSAQVTSQNDNCAILQDLHNLVTTHPG